MASFPNAQSVPLEANGDRMKMNTKRLNTFTRLPPSPKEQVPYPARAPHAPIGECLYSLGTLENRLAIRYN